MTQYCEKIPLEWLSQSPQSPKQNKLIKSPYNEKYTCKGRKVQQMPHLDTSPKQLDTSTCSVFELDGSDIQRPGDIWRNSWHTVRGLVIGGRAGGTPTSERSERSLSVVPDLPIPSSAAIARRNEVRWKPSYLGSWWEYILLANTTLCSSDVGIFEFLKMPYFLVIFYAMRDTSKWNP